MADLATTISTATDSAISNGGTKPWLSTQDDTTPSYALSTECWAYGLSSNNFRSRAVWNAKHGRRNGPTLIAEAGKSSSRFAVVAKHWYSAGSGMSGLCRWIKADGTPVERNVIAYRNIGSTDIQLVMLDSPIDASDVGAAVLLPLNVADYIKWERIPGISVLSDNTDQQLRAVCVDIVGDGFITTVPTNAGRLGYNESPFVSGASGSPLFVVVSGQEVICGTWYRSGFAERIYSQIPLLDIASSAMSGESISLAVLSLSGFDDILPKPPDGTYYWTGAVDGNLNNPANYLKGGSVPTNVPGVNDILNIVYEIPGGSYMSAFPSSGVCVAEVEASNAVNEGATWMNKYSHLASTIMGGDFNDVVIVKAMVSRARFNGDVYMKEYEAALVPEDEGYIQINNRLTFDDGATWLYSPNSPDIAKSQDVRQGVTNAGVSGLLVVPSLTPGDESASVVLDSDAAPPNADIYATVMGPEGEVLPRTLIGTTSPDGSFAGWITGIDPYQPSIVTIDDGAGWVRQATLGGPKALIDDYDRAKTAASKAELDAMQDHGDEQWVTADMPTAAEIAAALAGSTVNYHGPILAGGAIQIIAGDAVTLSWTINDWAGTSLDGQPITLRMLDTTTYRGIGQTATLVKAGTASQTGTDVALTVALTANETASLFPAAYRGSFVDYEAQVAADGRDATILQVAARVGKRVTGGV